MAKIAWVFRSVTVGVFTTKVLSASYNTGRESQYDTYSPGGLTFTIDNSTNYVTNFNLADKITLRDKVPISSFWQDFYISSIDLNDAGGNGEGSTATITCVDVLGRLGRVQMFNKVIATNPTMTQLQTAFTAEMPPGTSITAVSPGNSDASNSAAFSSTILDRINSNITTEQGTLYQQVGSVLLNGRSTVIQPSGISFNRSTAGGNEIVYTNLIRKMLGDNYINSFTVTPENYAAQNAFNTAGQTLYGTYSSELASVDNSTGQALALAQWMVYSRDDPEALSFTLEFSDIYQDTSDFMIAVQTANQSYTINYFNPGSNTPQTKEQILQGFQMQMTPEETVFTCFFTPLTFVNFFTLDSTTLGVLDTSRVAW